MDAETRMKVKQYNYERDALKKWLEDDVLDISTHVVNAVLQRLRIVERELMILQK
jgi:hypothetical protein